MLLNRRTRTRVDAVTQTHSQLGYSVHAEGNAPFDAVFVLCGLPPRTSDLAPLGLPPGLLPLDSAGTTNLDRQFEAVRPIQGTGDAPISESRFRVLVEKPFDSSTVGRPELEPSFLTDKDRYRGTGGVLRDAADELDDDARILVMTGSEIFEDGLSAAIETVAGVDADVVLCRRANFSPAGLWSIRARCLRRVSGVGYADFKEQVLADLTDSRDIRVATLARSDRRHHAVRDLSSYLACLADLREEGGPDVIALPGVERAPDALIVDSVLLRGAVIEPGAVVARSVIGPGVRVRSGQTVVDEVLTDSEKGSRGGRSPRGRNGSEKGGRGR